MPLAVFRAVLMSGASWLPYIAIQTPLRPEPAVRVRTSSAPPVLP